MALTKSDILNGSKATKDVEIKSLKGEVTIRQLTGGEVAHAQALAVRGQKFKPTNSMKQGDELSADGIDMDLEKTVQAQHASNIYCVAQGLSCNGEKWTENEVNSLGHKAIEEIAQAVEDYTNGTEESEDAESFRSDEGGDGDASAE